MSNTETFDVVVVGGGPGGSTLAALVAKQGHSVLVLEKEFFPRYQIGESLLPSTVHGVCRLSGAADELAKAGFPKKLGGTFRWGANPEPWTFFFSVSPRMAGPTSTAYQVERSKFDKILLDNARRVGAQVREGCAVSEVLEEGDRVAGVRYTDDQGTEHTVSARFVVTPPATRAGSTSTSAASGSTRTSSATWRCSATSRTASGCPSRPGTTSCASPSTAAGSGTSR